MTNQKRPFTEWDVEVAKRSACAVISYQAGMSSESLWEQYDDQNEDIGTYGLSVAKESERICPRNRNKKNAVNVDSLEQETRQLEMQYGERL